MKELTKKVIERLVFIASDFYRVDKSEVALLNEAGYFEFHDQINENEIAEILKMHPHLIAEWLRFSEDSRSSFRWGFGKGNNGDYCVGHWPPGKEFEEIITPDGFYACAAFIKRHVESIRILFKK